MGFVSLDSRKASSLLVLTLAWGCRGHWNRWVILGLNGLLEHGTPDGLEGQNHLDISRFMGFASHPCDFAMDSCGVHRSPKCWAGRSVKEWHGKTAGQILLRWAVQRQASGKFADVTDECIQGTTWDSSKDGRIRFDDLMSWGRMSASSQGPPIPNTRLKLGRRTEMTEKWTRLPNLKGNV